MKFSRHDLQGSLRESLLRHQVPGASVALLYDGELITLAEGVVNVETGVELTPETVMHIGSIAKVFNATLVMQLVDEGKVDLDESVLRYLPDLRLKDPEALKQITVKMLLNHTSGIDGPMLPDHGHDDETIEKGIARFAELGQIHSPGAEYSYCNAATVIAGYLAQRLAGKSWYRLVRERIFDRLKMEHSATLPEEALLHRAGVGHYLTPEPNQKLVRVSHVFLPLSFSPGGTSLMMSARDLITFSQAHIANGLGLNGARILSERSAKDMRQMTVNNRGKGYTYTDGIGIGWMVSEDGLLYHSGGGPGIASVLYVRPENGFAVAILTNAEFGLSWNLISEWITQWLKDAGLTRPANIRSSSAHVSIDPGRYTGTYENGTYRYIVSERSDGLALSAQAKVALYDYISMQVTPAARLAPIGEGQFVLESRTASSSDFSVYAFRNSDAEGRMRHLGNGDRLFLRVSS